MSDVLDRSISSHRFNRLMLGGFSLLAVMLASIGVYGLTAYAVVQRTHQIGIRVSLGASPSQVVRGLLLDGLRLAAAGATAGFAGTVVLGRLLSGPCSESPRSTGPRQIVVIAATTAVVVAATYGPAARASAIDPMLALKDSGDCRSQSSAFRLEFSLKSAI